MNLTTFGDYQKLLERASEIQYLRRFYLNAKYQILLSFTSYLIHMLKVSI